MPTDSAAGLAGGWRLLHAVCALVLILGVVIHIYAAIWVKGSLAAMTRRYVTSAWARKHHPAWFRKISGERG